ncbi:hypothetical protein HK102_011939 [Quaeritorhiza haematococci]|nr:hypothetical protein HK102_011939 [Quaeritorhiza haematococci]
MATHKAHSQLPRHQQQQQSHKGVKGSSTAAPQKQSLSLKEQQRQNSARLSKPKYVVDPKQRSNSHAHLQSNQERDVIAMMNDSSWVDRVAKEMKAQSEWSEKWTFMNDPKLYMGPDAPDKYPAKPKVT